jgi:hypothetical protein
MSNRSVAIALLVAIASFSACQLDEQDGPTREVSLAIELPPFSAGERLRARVVAADGVDSFVTFFDQEKNTDCEFTKTRFGTRCVPPQGPSYYFADPNCKTPVAVQAPCSNNRYLSIQKYGCEAEVTEVYEIQGPSALTTVYSLVGQSCVAGTTQDQIFETTPVDLQEFVGGTIEEPTFIGDLGVRRVVGDDGSKLTLNLMRAEQVCRPRQEGQAYRCIDLSLASYFAGTFFNGPCVDDLVGIYQADGCNPPPTLAVDATAEAQVCNPPLTLSSTMPLAQVSMHDPATQACVAAPSSYPDSYVALGPVVDVPHLDRMELGSGRVKAVHFGAESQALVSAYFYDTQISERCEPNLSSLGDYRCFPASNLSAEFFEDKFCTKSLISYVAPDDECVEPARFLPRLNSPAAACEPRAVEEVWERGAEYTGHVYQLGINCEEVFPQNFLPAPPVLYSIAHKTQPDKWGKVTPTLR